MNANQQSPISMNGRNIVIFNTQSPLNCECIYSLPIAKKLRSLSLIKHRQSDKPKPAQVYGCEQMLSANAEKRSFGDAS